MGTRRWGIVTALLAALTFVGAATAGSAPATTAGTLVSSVALPPDKWVPGAASATGVTYWSTGPADQPMLSSGAIYVPHGEPPAGGWPIVSWAHGTVGMGDHCAPSIARRSSAATTFFAHWLRQGYALVATDYVGLGTPGVHPYLDGPSAAHSVIDMVRAARSLNPDLSRKWVAMGASQGGQAAMFTAHIATAYAPELDYRGAVATGVPSNLENLLSLAGPYVPALPLQGTTIYLAFVLAGIRATEPRLDINSYLTPFGIEMLDRVDNLCYLDADALLRAATIGQILARPLQDPPVVAAIHRMLEIPTSGYDRPIFIGQGITDADVPAPLTAKLVAELLLNRVNVEFRLYPRAHLETVADSLPDTTAFVRQLLSN